MEKTLTVFTPTFNRAGLLARAYESLCRQSCKDFVWMIVDDGSTDDTKAVVREWMRQGIIEIRYYAGQNGGKHTAYNRMLDELDTGLVLIALDSDDYLKDNAVEIMLKAWEERRPGTEGIVFACERPGEGKILYRTFARALEEGQVSLKTAFRRGLFKGEAEYLIRGSLLKPYRYPVYPGEKFVTEAYVYIQIDGAFEWKKESVYIRDYQRGGLTDSRYSCYCENPRGWLEYNRLRFATVSSPVRKAKYAVFIRAFQRIGGIYRRESYALAERVLLSCCLLPGICLAEYMKRRGAR